MDTPTPDSFHPHETQFLSPKLTLLFAIAIMLFAFIGIVFIQVVKRQTNSTVTTYDSCVKAKGSTILESYPSVCVSVSGKRFIQPLTDEEQRKLVPPTEPTSSPEEKVVYSLPLLWQEVKPDPSMQATDQKVQTLEFAKLGESRSYPIGRVTLQYSKDQGSLVPPDSVFDPEHETLNGVAYEVVVGEENGAGGGNFSYRVYYGTTIDKKYALRIFTRFQSDGEKEEQKKILSSFLFVTPTPQPVSSPPSGN
ncbi:MAG: hypothetical protein ABI758_02410 [Candidatus Woesebacteria bacterium]